MYEGMTAEEFAAEVMRQLEAKLPPSGGVGSELQRMFVSAPPRRRRERVTAQGALWFTVGLIYLAPTIVRLTAQELRRRVVALLDRMEISET